MKESTRCKTTGKQKRILLQLISYAIDRKKRGLDSEYLSFINFKEDVELKELEVLAGKIAKGEI